MDDIKVTYVNHTRNTERPIVFVFAKNGIPVFDTLRDGVAWRAFERIGHGLRD